MDNEVASSIGNNTMIFTAVHMMLAYFSSGVRQACVLFQSSLTDATVGDAEVNTGYFELRP